MSDDIFCLRNLKINRSLLRVYRNDKELLISLREMRLLFILATEPNTVFSMSELMMRLGGITEINLNAIVCNLRKKLKQEFISTGDHGYGLDLVKPEFGSKAWFKAVPEIEF